VPSTHATILRTNSGSWGEFVCFIGTSGCGKTTLLRAVADLETPTSGSIRVNGMSPHQARASRAYGYVFQAPALYIHAGRGRAQSGTGDGRQLTHSRLPNGFRRASSAAIAA
jgi:ABC-type thiamine transport system ATPase subunit